MAVGAAQPSAAVVAKGVKVDRVAISKIAQSPDPCLLASTLRVHSHQLGRRLGRAFAAMPSASAARSRSVQSLVQRHGAPEMRVALMADIGALE